MKSITAYTDGSYFANIGKGGAAAHIDFGDSETTIQKGYSEGKVTNNRMELSAVVEMLKYLISKDEEYLVWLYSDSQYVVKALIFWIDAWKRNDWKTREGNDVLNQDIFKELDELRQHFKIKPKWVKGHAQSTRNNLVDELAKEAANNVEDFKDVVIEESTSSK